VPEASKMNLCRGVSVIIVEPHPLLAFILKAAYRAFFVFFDDNCRKNKPGLASGGKTFIAGLVHVTVI
jgi:hypothetical protein